jgi:hypothetical protein
MKREKTKLKLKLPLITLEDYVNYKKEIKRKITELNKLNLKIGLTENDLTNSYLFYFYFMKKENSRKIKYLNPKFLRKIIEEIKLTCKEILQLRAEGKLY